MNEENRDRLDTFDSEFRALMSKHGFDNFVCYDFDINESFHSHVWGLSPDDEGLLLLGLSHTQACRCCREKEGEHD